jgi:hypothetical protein
MTDKDSEDFRANPSASLGGNEKEDPLAKTITS